MDNKDRPRRTFSDVPIPYAPGSVNWQTAAPTPIPTSGPGDFPGDSERLPVALLNRAIHFRGKWTGVPRKRLIHFFTLLYIKQGGGMLTINNAKVALDGPKLLLLAPGMHVVERFRAGAIPPWIGRTSLLA